MIGRGSKLVEKKNTFSLKENKAPKSKAEFDREQRVLLRDSKTRTPLFDMPRSIFEGILKGTWNRPTAKGFEEWIVSPTYPVVVPETALRILFTVVKGWGDYNWVRFSCEKDALPVFVGHRGDVVATLESALEEVAAGGQVLAVPCAGDAPADPGKRSRRGKERA